MIDSMTGAGDNRCQLPWCTEQDSARHSQIHSSDRVHVVGDVYGRFAQPVDGDLVFHVEGAGHDIEIPFEELRIILRAIDTPEIHRQFIALIDAMGGGQ